MTLNIKLPVDVVMTARRVYWDSDSNMGLAIIAALEKMVEIGMAEKIEHFAFTDDADHTLNYELDDENPFPALIIRLDAGEKHARNWGTLSILNAALKKPKT